DRPASDLTLQALSGGMAPRGEPGRPPIMAGGEPTAWFAGSVATAALLGALHRVRATSVGELLDVSQLESAHLEHCMYPVTFASVAGRPFHDSRGVPVPGIEPTSDGYVGFFVITGQQWLDFCALIEQPQWTEDQRLFAAVDRRRRAAELQPAIRQWTTQRTTDEIVEIASLMRIPVAPIGNGRTIPEIDHFVDQGWLVANPAGFQQPRRPYTFRDEPIADVAPSPPPASSDAPSIWPGSVEHRSRSASPSADLPLAGLRVADFTAFWAGPLAAQILAGLGAEVIHIEGPKRPDGIRMNTTRSLDQDGWWEWSALFAGANTDKRALTVDLSTEPGRDIALRLLATCDVMIENFSPRVIDQLGLGPDTVLATNPRLVMVRMPAFGLAGPWRDRVGFAQTIEQASGLAYVTGYEGEAPLIPNGMCDPLAAVHGAIATMVALRRREITGTGQVVEAPMIGAALATAAEQIVEYAVNGTLLGSLGNGSPFVEQHVFACAGDDEWVAVTLPDGSRDRLLAATGAADTDALSGWCAERSVADVEAVAQSLDIPAGRVTWAHHIVENPQLVARGYFETLTHPVIGTHPYVGFPVRFASGPHRWNRTAAPRLGGDNEPLLRELGFDDVAIAELTAAGVISTSVLTGQHGWG
ncbi:MAG: CoA transferase, partial [Actinobacteria bacterium]|nr:CoA transferase [Actinomycetota bacterium]